MGVEDQIRYELLQGATPTDLIKKGYSKSTAYKVQKSIQTFRKKLNPSQWEIRYIRFNKYGPYKPGEAVRMSFDLYNKSYTRNLYVKNIGIHIEWMEKDEIWSSRDIKDIVKPWTSKHVSMSFPIPEKTNPGESKISFFVEGEFIKEEMPVMTQVTHTPIVISN